MFDDAPKRRWYPFGVRTLVTTILMSAAGVGWIAFRVYRADVNRQTLSAEHRAVARIAWPRASVGSEYEQKRHPTWLEKLFGDPGDRENPVGVLRIRGLDLTGVEVSDSDLELVKGLADLQVLKLGRTDITDAQLRQLKELTNLETLDLPNTNVTDAGLEHLKALKSLESLDLTSTRVTANGVERLQRALPKCQIFK